MISLLDCLYTCVCVFFDNCVSLQVKTAEEYMALMTEGHFVEYENTMRMSQLVCQQLEFVVNAEKETAADLLAKFGPPVPDTVAPMWASKWPLLRTVAIKFHQVFTFIISSPSVVDELNDFHSLQREKVQTAERTWTMKHNPRLASLFTHPPHPNSLAVPANPSCAQFQLVALARAATTRRAPEAGGSPLGSGFTTSASCYLSTTPSSSNSRPCLSCPSHHRAQPFFGTKSRSL